MPNKTKRKVPAARASSRKTATTEVDSVRPEDCPDPTASLRDVFKGLRLNSNRLIYHYCNAGTLLSILEKRTIRFGEASRMNDGEELLWAEKQLRESMRRLHDRDDVPDGISVVSKKMLEKIKTEYERIALNSRQFISCFSTSGDSLSQWRSYADDAQGFAVGFCPDDLDLPAQLSFVEYDPIEQQNYIMKAIASILNESKRDSYGIYNFSMDLMYLYGRMSSFKNPAFADEREVRANHLAGFIMSADALPCLEYSGGTVHGKDVEDVEIKFRAAGHKVVPYIDFKFQVVSKCALREVWIGPRCPNSKSDIEVLLGTLGYTGVSVDIAGAKYRR